jgi:hypothetical protein
MVLAADTLRAAFAELPPVEGDDTFARGKPVAARLCAVIESVLADSEIAEVYFWGFNVEFVLKSGDHWAIECLSPNAFHMYPGLVRGDTVVWANVWVADDMTLDELVKQINDVALRATKKESENA